MKKGQVFLVAAASFFAGVALGFFASPVKNGIGNNSGNTTHYHYGEKHYLQDGTEQDCCGSKPEEAASGVTSGEAEVTA